MPQTNWTTGWCWLCFFLIASAYCQEQNSASKTEWSRADYYVAKLEAEARKHGDKPFKLGYDSKEALKRVADLSAKYSADPQVQKLLERAKIAVPWYFQETGSKQVEPDKPVTQPPEKKPQDKTTNDKQPDDNKAGDKAPHNEVTRADYFLKSQ